ncbi:MAG: hypothetical protein WA005_00080 [Candidatus Binataceae bacterium]
MNWIETLKYYEPLAEWATCLFVAYEVVKVKDHNRDAAPATQRRYWPWILAGVAATVIAWGPVVLPYFGILSGPRGHSTPERPLADDALKWKLATQLFGDFQSMKDANCRVTMIHNDSDYAEDLYDDAQRVLSLAGCTILDQPREYTLPRGLTVCSSRTAPTSRFAQALVSRLDDTAHIKSDFEFYDGSDIKCPMLLCPAGQTCFAVTIGNRAE